MAIQFTASNFPAKCKSSKNSGMVSVAALGICGSSRIGIYNGIKSVSYGFESHLPYQPKGKWTLALYMIKMCDPKG